jgi:hypothetical protein
MGMDSRTAEWLALNVELELYQELLDLNMVDRTTNMADIQGLLGRIKNVHGVLDRVVDNVEGKLKVVDELEDKTDKLAVKATAPAIRGLDSVISELTEVVNALEGNGGPPLDGENQSTPSDGQSVENPTQPQVKG